MKLRMDRDVLVLCTLIHFYILHLPAVQSCHSGQSVEGIDQTPHKKEVNPGEDATIICRISEQYNVNRTYVEKNCQVVISGIELKGTLYDFTVTIKNIFEAGTYYCMAVLQNQTEISGAGTYLSLPEPVTNVHAIIIAVVVVGGLVTLIGVAVYFYKHQRKSSKTERPQPGDRDSDTDILGSPERRDCVEVPLNRIPDIRVDPDSQTF